MTEQEILDRIEAIRQTAATDDESAHGQEDDLWASVLRAIAKGELEGVSVERAAALALTTIDINFGRWYA